MFVCASYLNVENCAHCAAFIDTGSKHVTNRIFFNVPVRDLHMQTMWFLGKCVLHIHVMQITCPYLTVMWFLYFSPQ